MNKNEEKFHDRVVLPISILSDGSDNDYFSLTKEEYRLIQHEMNNYENLKAVVIEALKIVQKRYGWVMDAGIVSIANVLGLSVSDVESVATFYNQIFREPVGRHIIRLCDSIVCYILEYQSIKVTFENILHVQFGQTTSDNRFTFLPVSCLGKCDQSPVIMIDDDLYTCVSSISILKILEKYL